MRNAILQKPFFVASLGLAVTVLCFTLARADIEVRFIESAPKDSFVIENVGGCDVGRLDVELDLAAAPVGLIFDTTGEGAGVEVFQPFEVVQGEAALIGAIAPRDGDQSVRLTLATLAPGDVFRFTVDVDALGERSELGQIRVSDAEIAGAVVRLNDEEIAFDGEAKARLPRNCAS